MSEKPVEVVQTTMKSSTSAALDIRVKPLPKIPNEIQKLLKKSMMDTLPTRKKVVKNKPSNVNVPSPDKVLCSICVHILNLTKYIFGSVFTEEQRESFLGLLNIACATAENDLAQYCEPFIEAATKNTANLTIKLSDLNTCVEIGFCRPF